MNPNQEILTGTIPIDNRIESGITEIQSNQNNQNNIMDNMKLFWNILRGCVLGIVLVFVIVTLGYYVLYNYLGQEIGTILTIIITYIIIMYTYKDLKKTIINHSLLIHIDGEGMSNKFFWMIIFPIFIESTLLVLFILGFGLKEGYMISIICAVLLLIISIVHIVLFWSRLGLHGFRLFQLDNPSNMNQLPHVVRNKLITYGIENQESTIWNHLLIPVIIFGIFFVLGILSINGFFG